MAAKKFAPRNACWLQLRIGIETMRSLVFILALLGLAHAQSFSPDSNLRRCQAVFKELRPAVLYGDKVAEGRFLFRLILTQKLRPVVRITLDGSFEPVPVGLEELARPFVLKPQAVRELQAQVRKRLETLRGEITLANWMAQQGEKGYRCFITYKGRVVGVLQMSSFQPPMAFQEWFDAYKEARLRWPATPPKSLFPEAEPPLNNPYPIDR